MAFITNPFHVTSGQRLNFVGEAASGVSPTTSLLTVPISIQTFGGLGNLLGKPDGFVVAQASGRDIKIPYYY